MLNNSGLKSKKERNDILCSKLAGVPGLQVKEIIQMSELGIGDTVVVRPSRYSNPFCVPSFLFKNGTKSLVCVKCRLPSNVIITDPELNALIGLTRLSSVWKRMVEFSAYMLVDENQMSHLHNVVVSNGEFCPLNGKLGNMLCNYGDVILSRQGCYKTAHEEAKDLVNIAGLKANFILPFDSDTREFEIPRYDGPRENEFGYKYEKCRLPKPECSTPALGLEEDLLMEVQQSENGCLPMCRKEKELRLVSSEELYSKKLISGKGLPNKKYISDLACSMWGTQYLEVMREYNNDLCKALSSFQTVVLDSAVQMGNTGPNNRMQVLISKSKNGSLPITHNTGSGCLFLLNCRVSTSVIIRNETLVELVGNALNRAKNGHVKVSMYVFVEDEKKDEFLESVFGNASSGCCNVPSSRASNLQMSVVTCYGTLVLSRVHGGPYDKFFNEQECLENLSGLYPDFLLEKEQKDSLCCPCIPRHKREKESVLLGNPRLENYKQHLEDLEYDMKNASAPLRRAKVSSDGKGTVSHSVYTCNLSHLSESVEDLLNAVNSDSDVLPSPCLREVSSLVGCANTSSGVVRSNTK
ncbi:DUF3023 domain-containing protein [Ehrlichia minasensis]|uniref:DUF3023 domain-containing protein n=1 Tax=Ehrlichia minasensis TaxID=1242993 RepID=A0A4Q6I711_9RICK|nr:DUF3023 domain-containing protein [Ehrlichia minasensis]RZB12379.1 DUF3023 domain-containing protein [Ehrlichia minasensis]